MMLFILLSADAFNLDLSKILLFGRAKFFVEFYKLICNSCKETVYDWNNVQKNAS